jgi:hypothetical protein
MCSSQAWCDALRAAVAGCEPCYTCPFKEAAVLLRCTEQYVHRCKMLDVISFLALTPHESVHSSLNACNRRPRCRRQLPEVGRRYCLPFVASPDHALVQVHQQTFKAIPICTMMSKCALLVGLALFLHGAAAACIDGSCFNSESLKPANGRSLAQAAGTGWGGAATCGWWMQQ